MTNEILHIPARDISYEDDLTYRYLNSDITVAAQRRDFTELPLQKNLIVNVYTTINKAIGLVKHAIHNSRG